MMLPSPLREILEHYELHYDLRYELNYEEVDDDDDF
jgi:hypothetical protein